MLPGPVPNLWGPVPMEAIDPLLQLHYILHSIIKATKEADPVPNYLILKECLCKIIQIIVDLISGIFYN